MHWVVLVFSSNTGKETEVAVAELGCVLKRSWWGVQPACGLHWL